MLAAVARMLSPELVCHTDRSMTLAQHDTPDCRQRIYKALRTMAVWPHPDPRSADVKLRTRACSTLGAVLVVAALAAACTPDPGPTPPATPTPQPSPTSASPTESAQEREQRVAFEDATLSYREFHKEFTRLSIAGGTNASTPLMKKNAAGPYLDFYTKILLDRKETATHATVGARIVYVKVGAYSADELTLKACEDASKNRVVDASGTVKGKGIATRLTIYVRPVEGRWKLWNGDDEKVSSCD